MNRLAVVLSVAALGAAALVVVPAPRASAGRAAQGTWVAAKISSVLPDRLVLLNTATGALRFSFVEEQVLKMYDVAAPDAARGPVRTYEIAEDGVFVDFPVAGYRATFVLTHTVTGASWYFNFDNGNWSPVVIQND